MTPIICPTINECRAKMLADIDSDAPIIGQYAETIAQNLALQRVRGQAAPEWRE